MRRIKYSVSCSCCFLQLCCRLGAQEVKRLTLDDVIRLSEEQSPNAMIAKHRFRASYWEYQDICC